MVFHLLSSGRNLEGQKARQAKNLSLSTALQTMLHKGYICLVDFARSIGSLSLLLGHLGSTVIDHPCFHLWFVLQVLCDIQKQQWRTPVREQVRIGQKYRARSLQPELNRLRVPVLQPDMTLDREAKLLKLLSFSTCVDAHLFLLDSLSSQCMSHCCSVT
jgi:hypothetical protein